MANYPWGSFSKNKGAEIRLTRLASSAPGHVKDTGTFDSTKSRVGWTLNKEEGALNSLSKYLFFWGTFCHLENPLLFPKMIHLSFQGLDKALVECLQFLL